ncbi:MAG TPA: LLM class flavin-dependent oxidoreductase [Dehalococcoidia bacterium]|nr:LLM class flavin-dependent oxidoreductase [Dehalococcoidia bacterium]
MAITFGVLAGHGGDWLGDAEIAEALGFDSVWVGDHVLWHAPSPDPAVVLGALAARTRRVRIGSGVMLAALRPPLVIAKQAATLDLLSGGRFILGVGAGGENPLEFDNVGIGVHERGGRLDETLAICRALWTRPEVNFDGRFYRLRAARFDLQPATAGGPPIWVGGRSAAALRRTGRLGDGWLAFAVTPERFAAGWRRVRKEAELAGRDPDVLTPALQLWCSYADDSKTARKVIAPAIEAFYSVPYERFARYCIAGNAADWRSGLQAYVDAGVRHINLIPAGGDVAGQLVQIAETTLPAFA